MFYLQNFFEITASKYPNYIAVNDHGKKTSYRKLDITANKLANLILKLNLKINERVCILTKKDINLYTSILGVLKSGGCWVPLSDQFPSSRINFLVNLTAPKIIIIDKEFLPIIKKFENKIKIIIINEKKKSKKYFTEANIIKEKKNKPQIKNLNSSSLAYIIYTSGSTGDPKGVMITHLNSSTYILNSKNYFKIKNKMKFAHISEIIFDPSIFDLFVCWYNCGTVVPMNKKEYKVNFINFFQKNRNINTCFVVPSLFEKLRELNQFNSNCLKSLRHVVFTGEFLSKDLVRDLLNMFPKCSFYNVYGTTETAIISHWHKISKKDLKCETIPVGKQLPQINTILIKNNNEEAKINERGNAFVYGTQVSRGYWKNDFLNKKYFCDNPTKKPIFEKLYNTGDVLYKNKDDIFFYFGRQDSQIKVRGCRVEIEEIENTFRTKSICKDITVIPFSRNNTRIYTDLIFYIRRDEKVKKNKKYFFSIATKLLPKFMQPSNIFLLDNDFPRNINGKIDKKELKKQFLKNIA